MAVAARDELRSAAEALGWAGWVLVSAVEQRAESESLTEAVLDNPDDAACLFEQAQPSPGHSFDLLGEGEALLTYLVGHNEISVFVVRRDRAEVAGVAQPLAEALQLRHQRSEAANLELDVAQPLDCERAFEDSARRPFLEDTYIKNFYTVAEYYNDYGGTGSMNYYVAGYMNTSSAVDAINFNMASGNLNGTIKLYGISKS